MHPAAPPHLPLISLRKRPAQNTFLSSPSISPPPSPNSPPRAKVGGAPASPPHLSCPYVPPPPSPHSPPRALLGELLRRLYTKDFTTLHPPEPHTRPLCRSPKLLRHRTRASPCADALRTRASPCADALRRPPASPPSCGLLAEPLLCHVPKLSCAQVLHGFHGSSPAPRCQTKRLHIPPRRRIILQIPLSPPFASCSSPPSRQA